MFIGVIGGSKCTDETAEMAREVGRNIAEKGGVLICGGLGGVMEWACKGAREAGGNTIGILPGEDRNEANPYVTIPIPTGLGLARNTIVVGSCDAVIALPGRAGTLSEIGFAMNRGIPVICLKSWDLHQAGYVESDLFKKAETPKEAVEMAFSLGK